MKIVIGCIVLGALLGSAFIAFHLRRTDVPASESSMATTTESDRVSALNEALRAIESGKHDEARLIWERLMVVDPADPVPYENLAKLYHYTLHDYPRAETYYQEFMRVASTSLTPYLELYELYAYSYKLDTSAAVDTLTEAARRFPQAPDPYIFLGEYYRDHGDRVQARTAFEQALAIVRQAGDLDRMHAIGVELHTVE